MAAYRCCLLPLTVIFLALFCKTDFVKSKQRRSLKFDIVKMTQQGVNLKLNIGEEHRLHFKYSQIEGFPIDLYYLMDLSKSMEDDKVRFSGLGESLANKMKKITSDFRIGFGTFSKLQNPCNNCSTAYGFKNYMSLSNDIDQFAKKVNNSVVSGNLDAPEGGFDAIMQAIVCRQNIGWRDQARKILIFSSTAGFRYAGDGKLGGVIEPNVGQCHLDHKGTYTHSSIQDYPSISQINTKVKEHHINIIFAVTKQQKEVYEKLASHVEGSTCGELEDDSSNVVELVKYEYNKITFNIQMRDNATGNVKVTYYSSCLTGGKPIQTDTCGGLTVGQVVSFEARITVTACPKDRNDWLQTFAITPVGIDESLIVNLEMLCQCSSDLVGEMYEKNSSKCNFNGVYRRGVCACSPNFYGRNCECSLHLDHNHGCRADNESQFVCNGRGTCICGECDCEKRPNINEIIYGNFCECDNFSCDRHNQLLCSGPDHGTCECGRCVCKPGWSGSACNCKESIDTCIPPGGTAKDVCSGRGNCVCGSCNCASKYSGTYCEYCPICSDRCEELKHCVQCHMYKTGPLADEELCKKNCTFVPIGQETVVANEELRERLCTFLDEEECRYQFTYTDNKDEVIAHAEQKRQCPKSLFSSLFG